MSEDLVAEGPAINTDDIFRYDYGEWEEEAELIEEEIYPPKRVLRYEEAMQKLSVVGKTEAYNRYLKIVNNNSNAYYTNTIFTVSDQIFFF